MKISIVSARLLYRPTSVIKTSVKESVIRGKNERKEEYVRTMFRFEIKMEALLVLNNLLKKGVKLPQDLEGARTK